jgi:peptide-N4-(N-acetyl-beta-glucosaminyl)asparagine amidase
MVCCGLGYKARRVLDLTDHVWTEVLLTTQQGKPPQWVHLDVCEKRFDAPLLYEAGWGKKLTYVFSFSDQAVVDVTPRYTQKWPEVLSRRTLVTE